MTNDVHIRDNIDSVLGNYFGFVAVQLQMVLLYSYSFANELEANVVNKRQTDEMIPMLLVLKKTPNCLSLVRYLLKRCLLFF